MSKLQFMKKYQYEEQKIILKNGNIIIKKSGQLIYTTGDFDDQMYVILKGSVLIRKQSVSKILGEIPFITRYDGEAFGEQEILFSDTEGITSQRKQTAIAVEDTILMTLS